MLNTFIKEYNKINKNKLFLNNKKSCTQKNFNFLPTFKIKIRRQSIQNNQNKFIEKIVWSSVKNKNIAIAIGINPSKAIPSQLDKTNEFLTYLIYNSGKKYDGYFLMNLYSFIQTKSFKKSKHSDQVEVIKNTINSFTLKRKNKNLDIIFFFGRSFYICKKQLNLLNSIKNAHFFATCDTNNLHCHPGRMSINQISLKYKGTKIKLTNGRYI